MPGVPISQLPPGMEGPGYPQETLSAHDFYTCTSLQIKYNCLSSKIKVKMGPLPEGSKSFAFVVTDNLINLSTEEVLEEGASSSNAGRKHDFYHHDKVVTDTK